MTRIETGRQAHLHGRLGALLLTGVSLTLAAMVDPGFLLANFLGVGWLAYWYYWATELPDTAAELRQKQRLQAEQNALGRMAPAGYPGVTQPLIEDQQWLRQQFALADELTNSDHRRLMEEL
jgi:hypothetical protein